MSSLSALAFRPIAQNVFMSGSARGMTRAPGLYSGWSISAGGGGGAAVGNMSTPTWGYGQGGRHGSSSGGNKGYNRNGVAPDSGGTTGVNVGGSYGTGEGGYSANGRPVGGDGGSHGQFGWHDSSIQAPRGSMPNEYYFGGNRGMEVIEGGVSTYYGRAGMGGTPPSTAEPNRGGGENSAPGYRSGLRRVLYG